MATHDAGYWESIERNIAYIAKEFRNPENVVGCSFDRGRIQWPDPEAGMMKSLPTKGVTLVITINGGATVTNLPGPPED